MVCAMLIIKPIKNKTMNSYVGLKGRARLPLANRVLRNLVLTTVVVLAAMPYVSAGMLRATGATVYRLEAPNSMLQDIEVRGTIRDSTGSLLTGVSIHVKNRTSIGTTTDLNGRYVLSLPAGSTLTFSMVGFEKIGRAHV